VLTGCMRTCWLPPFPTRRSSDLVAAPLVRWVDTVRQQERHGAGVVREHPVGRASRSPIVLLPHHLHGTLDDRGEEIGERAVEVRSEEHTSELQSRFALVCRLLLE